MIKGAGLISVLAICLALSPVPTSGGQESDLESQKPTVSGTQAVEIGEPLNVPAPLKLAEQQLPSGIIPAPEGGHYYAYSPVDSNPCNFDSLWDFTGGQSPARWAGRMAYGPECEADRLRAEWLLWFSRGRHVPQLAITGTTSAQLTGSYGNDPIGESVRNGLRLTYGHLLNDGVTWAEGRFWGLEDSSETFAVTSAQAPFIASPIFSSSLGLPINDVLAAPGIFTGSFHARSKNDLFGADFWFRRDLWRDNTRRFGVLAGYQFTRLDDSIEIDRSVTLISTGFRANGHDLFGTQNQFHGASLGFLAEWRRDVWTLELLGKIGLGNVHEHVVVSGRSDATLPGLPTVGLPFGFYAQPSNSGTYNRNRFAAVPELNVNGVYNISPAWRLLGGYSILYWSNVVLAGDQIDTRLNFTQNPPGPLVGPLRPLFGFRGADFVVQGLSLGADYRW